MNVLQKYTECTKKYIFNKFKRFKEGVLKKWLTYHAERTTSILMNFLCIYL